MAVVYRERCIRSGEVVPGEYEELFADDELLSVEGLQDATDAYLEVLKTFVDRHRIQGLLKEARVDHIGVKVKDADDLARHIQGLSGESDWIVARQVTRRGIASVRLNTPLSLGDLSDTRMVEFAEPRLGKQGDSTRINHAAIVPAYSFKDIAAFLEAKNIHFNSSGAGNESYILVSLNEAGQELKLTDATLEEKALKSAANRKGYFVKQPVTQFVR